MRSAYVRTISRNRLNGFWPISISVISMTWTRSWADEVWTGAITPLMWSVRGNWMKVACQTNYPPFEIEDLADLRAYKFHQGTAYYNTRADQLIAQYMLPPSLREPLLERLHPSQLDKALNAPFDLERCISMLLGIEETIRESETLSTLIKDFEGAAFFEGSVPAPDR